jgi:tetratricopeptide (TPR) repeat protein
MHPRLSRNSKLEIGNSKLETGNSKFEIRNCLLLTAFCLYPLPFTLFRSLFSLHPSLFVSRLPAAYCLLPAAGGLRLGSFSPAVYASTQKPSGPASKTPPEAKERFDEARRLLGGGYLENALASVQQGLKVAPDSVEGLNLLGIVYQQKRDYAQAVAAFEKALKVNPRSAETHNDLGNAYYAQQKLDLATEEFQKALGYEPANRDANYNLGLVLLAKHDPQGAITYLRRVRPADDPQALFSLAQAYFATGQTEKALETARSLSGRAKSDVRVHFTLGVLLASQKQYAPAIHELEIADALEPGTLEILYNLGQAYLRTQKYAQAEEVLERAIASKPDSAETLYLLAQVDADQRKDLQALELLLRARKLAPRNTDIIFLMGRLSMMQSYFEDAIQLLEQGVKIDPQRADLHAALGESYFTVGKVDRAIQEFDTLIKLDPSARSYAFMGLCYRHLGRFDEAKKYFSLGLQSNPRNPACLFNLGYIENKQGNYAVAEKYLVQAIDADSNYGDALYELAGVKMAEKKYAEALPVLQKCVKLKGRPSSEAYFKEVYYKLAVAERNLHQPDAAQRDLRIFETLSKEPSPGPYPFQHFFEDLDERAGLPPEKRAEFDLREFVEQVEKHPNQPGNLYLLAEAYLKLGRNDEARKTVERLDKLSGGDARTAVGVGTLLARYRLYLNAIQHFQNAIAADPSSDDARYNLADAYFQSHDYRRALEAIQQVSVQGQDDDAVLALLGDIQAHLGNTTEAIHSFGKVIARNPDNDQAYLFLALTQMQAGDTGAAERTLSAGLGRVPDSGRLFWGRGVFAAFTGQNTEAEANFKRAADLMPDWQSSYSALGIFYYETGQIAEARETLSQYQKLFPHGGLNVSGIQQALQKAESPESKIGNPKSLPPEARLRFLQVALALAEL